MHSASVTAPSNEWFPLAPGRAANPNNASGIPPKVASGVRKKKRVTLLHAPPRRLCLLESVSATPTIAIRFREAVLACVPGLAQGRAELADADSLLPETESSIVVGAVSLATRSIIAGETEKLPELLPDLTDFTLSPYLGAERAAELAAGSRSE